MADRLAVLVEGPTEESFVSRVLGSYLRRRGYVRVDARSFSDALGKPHGGGIVKWEVARRLIAKKLAADPHCIVTTMVDYYGLPQSWIDRASLSHQLTSAKSEVLRRKLADDIQADRPDVRDHSRFVPYVSMHEFEGLLFSDCRAFAESIRRPDLVDDLQSIRDAIPNGTPEDINEKYDLTPARRIQQLVPEYRKPINGTRAALAVTVDTMRSECPEFNRWVEALLRLADGATTPIQNH